MLGSGNCYDNLQSKTTFIPLKLAIYAETHSFCVCVFTVKRGVEEEEEEQERPAHRWKSCTKSISTLCNRVLQYSLMIIFFDRRLGGERF
jgi:hypothetical protein